MPQTERYVALDAMRGFVMLVLCSAGFGLGYLNKNPNYRSLAQHFHHLDWECMVAWELIMPTFMFIVGASLPFALKRREWEGAGFAGKFRHVGLRALKLILLGQILTTLHKGRYGYEPYETLTQLGLSCFCAFLILELRPRWQPVAAALFLVANWLLYQLFPGAAGPFSPNDNIGVVIDQEVFNLDHTGSWATLNFLGSSITVLFGSWTTLLLLSQRSQREKIGILVAAAAVSLALGLLLNPILPVIHKAWTISFTFWHTGCVLTGVTLFFWLFDCLGFHRAAFPLVVVGLNSIFIYLVHETLDGWTSRWLRSLEDSSSWEASLRPCRRARLSRSCGTPATGSINAGFSSRCSGAELFKFPLCPANFLVARSASERRVPLLPPGPRHLWHRNVLIDQS
ncbi:MAG: DUF1624 domain-containing protein [Pedosphaera sp.]|nr:DUF1624 domain-containing protein [Pedosphaera sp.]